MNDIVRERMKGIKGEFTTAAFEDIKNADAAFSKMVRRGEIKCVDKIRNGSGASRKVYVVLNLNDIRPPKDDEESRYMAIRRLTKEKDRAIVDNWRRVFPNWFTFDFKAIGKTVHKPKMGD